MSEEQQSLLPVDANPSPDVAPYRVIEIQLDALKHNDDQNSGIEICFRFASPANKSATGPLPRFIQMIKNPFYDCMLNFTKATFVPHSSDGSVWKITITKAQTDHVFIWALSRQVAGEFKDCWMTDSVVKIQ